MANLAAKITADLVLLVMVSPPVRRVSLGIAAISLGCGFAGFGWVWSGWTLLLLATIFILPAALGHRYGDSLLTWHDRAGLRNRSLAAQKQNRNRQ